MFCVRLTLVSSALHRVMDVECNLTRPRYNSSDLLLRCQSAQVAPTGVPAGRHIHFTFLFVALIMLCSMSILLIKIKLCLKHFVMIPVTSALRCLILVVPRWFFGCSSAVHCAFITRSLRLSMKTYLQMVLLCDGCVHFLFGRCKSEEEWRVWWSTASHNNPDALMNSALLYIPDSWIYWFTWFFFFCLFFTLSAEKNKENTDGSVSAVNPVKYCQFWWLSRDSSVGRVLAPW